MDRVHFRAEDFHVDVQTPGTIQIEDILVNVITRVFPWLPNLQVYIDGHVNVGENIKFAIRVERDNEIPPDTDWSGERFMLDYYQHHQSSLANLKAAFYPTVKAADLHSVGLSPDQFLIRLVDVSMSPDIRVYRNSEAAETFVGENIYVDLTLHIEDISVFEPEGDLYLLTKYRYLCEHGGTGDLELWLYGLGYETQGMSKDQMCATIRRHYGF